MIANIALDDGLILSHRANPTGSNFRERHLPIGTIIVALMTQKEVLNFKPAPRLEQIGDKCSKQVDDRKHRIR